jgi:ribosome-associated protein
LNDIRKLQQAAVAALEDIKAHDIEVYDVAHLTSLFDRVIIGSADSARQLNALAGHVQERAKAAGGRVYGIEGEDGGDWVLIDLGDIVVHIMQPAVRSHYNLEELWDQPKPREPRAKRASAAKHESAAKRAPAAKRASVAKRTSAAKRKATAKRTPAARRSSTARRAPAAKRKR